MQQCGAVVRTGHAGPTAVTMGDPQVSPVTLVRHMP
jgi:hypothetical protein